MASNTPFSFVNYQFIEFSYKQPANQQIGLELNFSPSGTYNPKTGLFTLYVSITCFVEKTPIEIIKAALEAEFKFAEPILFSEIPTYFYINSIAIVFPYVRAFISTLTLQANSGLMQIPIMNLTSLEKTLKERTSEIS
jgi:preprotein translocase subunit SecB